MSLYQKTLQKNQIPFPCPHCCHVILARDFEEHCAAIHQLNITERCVWCFGHEKRSNPHLLKCYASFCQSLETPLPDQPRYETPTLMNLDDCTENVDMNDSLPREPIWEVKPTLSGILYQCDRLNLAVACFQWFLRVEKETDWYHVTISATQYHRFVKAMDMDAGKTRTLPFSCLCKMSHRGASHRHFILVSSSKGQFGQFWKKIGGMSTQKQRVVTPIDLLHALGSVSQGKPSCEGDTFFTVTPLPSFYSLVLAVQWDGGLMELLQETYALIDPYLLAPVAYSFNGLWGVRVRDLPGIAHHIVLPVTEHFHPTFQPTDYFIYLTKGQKLFFERKEAVANIQAQAEKGNLFYDIIGDEIYYPTPTQQKCIRILQPIAEQIIQMKYTVEGHEQEKIQLEHTLEMKQKQNKLLKKKYKMSESIIKRLQQKHIAQLERENDNLRLENMKSKRQRFFYRASL